MIGQLAGGMLTTVEIFLLTLVFSLPLGMLVAFGYMSKNPILHWILKIYISIMRGTPLMLQLIVVYFGPYYILGIQISSAYRGTAVIIAFALNYAAYFAEIFRSGIQAVPRGQFEAARVLGMSAPLTMRRIVLPQVLRITLPPVSNETINLVKDTSLVYILAMNDLLRVARTIVQREFDMTPFLIAGIFYLAMTAVLTYGFKKLEAHYGRYDN